MDSVEFGEWLAYNRLNPPMEVRLNYGFALQCYMQAMINRSKRTVKYKIEDFLLKFGPAKKAATTMQEMKAKMMQWAGLKNKQEDVKERKAKK